MRDDVAVELRQRDRKREFEAHHARVAAVVPGPGAHRRHGLDDRDAEFVEEDVLGALAFVVGAAPAFVHRQREHERRADCIDQRVAVGIEDHSQ